MLSAGGGRARACQQVHVMRPLVSEVEPVSNVKDLVFLRINGSLHLGFLIHRPGDQSKPVFLTIILQQQLESRFRPTWNIQ